MKFAMQFSGCMQDSQVASLENPEENHMFSRVFFVLKVDDILYTNMYTDVRQPYGSNYREDPIEFCVPKGKYQGPFPGALFTDLVEQYYRMAMNSFAAMTGMPIGAGKRAEYSNNLVSMKSPTFSWEWDPASADGWELDGRPRWIRAEPRPKPSPSGAIPIGQGNLSQAEAKPQPSAEDLDRDK